MVTEPIGEAPGDPAALSFHDVGMVFKTRRGAIHALESVAFDVSRGAFVSIVGRSGCGKSTLLRLAAGLIAPTSGSVLFEGAKVAGPLAKVGFVFQFPVLMEWRDVIGNVMLPTEVLGLDGVTARERARSLLRTVGLEAFERYRPRQLSGGMQQRVAIVRALVSEPEVLLMDEPFGSLDALTRDEMAQELLGIWSMTGTTILFVTHSIDEAILMSDTVIVMTPRPGQVKAVVQVDLPRPRTDQMRSSIRFGELRDVVRVGIYERQRLAGSSA